MKVKKDLEFTLPLDEYAYPQKDANHISKDEFHQKPSPEPEVAQGKNWMKKLRYMLAAGAATVVLLSTTAGNKEAWGKPEFDIEINGNQFHFPCQFSEALDFAEREGHPLERMDGEYGEYGGGNWDAWPWEAMDKDFGFRAYASGASSIRECSWDAIALRFGPLYDYKSPLSFNYKGITEDSTWNDCISVLGTPYCCTLSPSLGNSGTWYMGEDKSSPNITIDFKDGVKMDYFYIDRVPNRPLRYDIIRSGEKDTKEDSDVWFSIYDEFTDTNTGSFLDGIYIFDTDEGIPDHAEDIAGKNLLGDYENEFEEVIVGGDTDNTDSSVKVYRQIRRKSKDIIRIPKPEFERWSIAFVFDHGGNENAVICSYGEELFPVPGGGINLRQSSSHGWYPEIELILPY